MFNLWGDLAYRHRKLMPVVIIAIIGALYFFAGTKLDERMSTEGWDDPGSSSTAAARIEAETFGRDSSGDVVVLYHAPEGKTVDDPEFAAKVSRSLEALKTEHADAVKQVTSYHTTRAAKMATQDRQTAFASVGLQGDKEEVLQNYRKIKDALPVDGVDTEIAGATPVADALDEGMGKDIQRAELIGLPLVALLLLFVFGSAVAAVMPLLVGILSILGSLGILSLIASVTTVNTFAQSVVTLLGLGLAIDYGLFMVSRFREELAEDAEVPDAVRTATATAGKTVVFSALMVIVALSGLFLFPQAFLQSVAYGAIAAVGLAALLAITVLPAVLGLLGKNIDRLAIRKVGHTKVEATHSFWGKIPAWAMRHSKVMAASLVGLLLLLTFPLVGIKFGGINETYLPPKNETRQAQEHFNELFPEFRTEPVRVVVANAEPQQFVEVYQKANEVEGLTGRFTVARETVNGTTVISAGIADRADYTRVVHELEAIEAPEGAQVYIGGTPAMEVESLDALMAKLPWMALYMIIATLILLAAMFGSVILPIKAIIMNFLGLGATLGLLTLMFVDGVGANLLGYSPGPLMSPVLVLIIAIVYGLSTDYEVFLLSRMVEARERGATTEQAIRYGTANTGNIITAAAVIMIVVAGAFGFSDIVMMKYIAFGMIAALVLDATIIRMLLVPAVMKLLADDNWWAPRWVKQVSKFIGHQEELPQATALFDAMDDENATKALPPAPRHADAQPITVAELMARQQQQLRELPPGRR
ncbi:MMPL family transporter [Corynebacterium ulceribovis]|uniref:MMPL family transporter n=1 Tax=Corynebacterium ulceribovis TaxID=487732 RepID=UPI0003766186|nr:MMPL family transporter [Corynebacterium ulceribovis]